MKSGILVFVFFIALYIPNWKVNVEFPCYLTLCCPRVSVYLNVVLRRLMSWHPHRKLITVNRKADTRVNRILKENTKSSTQMYTKKNMMTYLDPTRLSCAKNSFIKRKIWKYFWAHSLNLNYFFHWNLHKNKKKYSRRNPRIWRFKLRKQSIRRIQNCGYKIVIFHKPAP